MDLIRGLRRVPGSTTKGVRWGLYSASHMINASPTVPMIDSWGLGGIAYRGAFSGGQSAHEGASCAWPSSESSGVPYRVAAPLMVAVRSSVRRTIAPAVKVSWCARGGEGADVDASWHRGTREHGWADIYVTQRTKTVATLTSGCVLFPRHVGGRLPNVGRQLPQRCANSVGPNWCLRCDPPRRATLLHT